MPEKNGCVIVILALVVGVTVIDQIGVNEVVGRVVGGGVMCLAGAMFALFGILGARYRLETLRKGETVLGKVVDERSTSDGTNPIVEYKDHEAQTRRQELSFMSTDDWYLYGEIELLRDPETGRVEPVEFSGWFIFGIATVLGSAVFFCGVGWLVFGG